MDRTEKIWYRYYPFERKFAIKFSSFLHAILSVSPADSSRSKVRAWRNEEHFTWLLVKQSSLANLKTNQGTALDPIKMCNFFLLFCFAFSFWHCPETRHIVEGSIDILCLATLGVHPALQLGRLMMIHHCTLVVNCSYLLPVLSK